MATSSDPDSPNRRRRRVVAAGHLGDAATARGHLDDPSPIVRASALGALARCGELHHDELVRALGDTDHHVRRRAAVLATRQPATAEALVGLLEDPDDRVVEVAAFALGEHPDAADPARADEHTDTIVAALSRVARGHRDSLCRESATAALGAIGDPAGLDAVLDACSDRATVRRRAVLALAAFDDPRASEALRRLSGDRDLQVRQAAEDLLAIEEGEEVGGSHDQSGRISPRRSRSTDPRSW